MGSLALHDVDGVITTNACSVLMFSRGIPIGNFRTCTYLADKCLTSVIFTPWYLVEVMDVMMHALFIPKFLAYGSNCTIKHPRLGSVRFKDLQ